MYFNDLQSKKVDLLFQKGFWILVSGNAVHFEVYDSINLLAKAHVLIDLKQESWSWREHGEPNSKGRIGMDEFGMPMPVDWTIPRNDSHYTQLKIYTMY